MIGACMGPLQFSKKNDISQCYTQDIKGREDSKANGHLTKAGHGQELL